jgi:hypothetical protein
MGTLFWKKAWLAIEPLCVLYPRLYSIASNQEWKVGEMWGGSRGGWRWNFEWRRELFVWEGDLFHNLIERLEGVILGDSPDCWVWKPEEGGGFSVKSSYIILQNLCLKEGGVSTEEERVFRDL